mgnify:CR=1 FL=1
MFKKIIVGVLIAGSAISLAACASPSPKPTASHVEVVPVKQVDLDKVKDGETVTVDINSVQLVKVNGDKPKDLKVSFSEKEILQYVERYSNDNGTTFDPALLPVTPGKSDVTFDNAGKIITLHYIVK